MAEKQDYILSDLLVSELNMEERILLTDTDLLFNMITDTLVDDSGEVIDLDKFGKLMDNMYHFLVNNIVQDARVINNVTSTNNELLTGYVWNITIALHEEMQEGTTIEDIQDDIMDLFYAYVSVLGNVPEFFEAVSSVMADSFHELNKLYTEEGGGTDEEDAIFSKYYLRLILELTPGHIDEED